MRGVMWMEGGIGGFKNWETWEGFEDGSVGKRIVAGGREQKRLGSDERGKADWEGERTWGYAGMNHPPLSARDSAFVLLAVEAF